MAELFPQTTVGGVKLSRLLIGSNTFGGYSHFSAARDRWLKKYFTVDKIVEVLEACSARGLNGMVSGAIPLFYDALKMHEDKTGRKIHWIVTPGGSKLAGAGGTLEDQIDWSARHGVTFIMPHPCWTDNHLLIDTTEITGFDDVIKRVRDLGMIPGVSTHRPETVVVCDKHPYPVETYIQIFNVDGFLMPVETDWCAKVIREANHPVMCIKPLAAGRVMPSTGFRWSYQNQKPTDMIVAGFMSPEEANEDIDICLEVLTGVKHVAPLQVTRSKEALVK